MATGLWSSVAGLLALLLAGMLAVVPLVAAGGELVGPGAMQRHGGGGGGSRFRGFSRPVQDWPVGFFLGGSTLQGLNGLYDQVEEGCPAAFPHYCHLLYRNPRTDWLIAYVDVEQRSPEHKAVGGKKTEWVIIDKDWRDRFGHEGDTYLMGAGPRWEHLKRGEGTGPYSLTAGARVSMQRALPGYWETGDLGTIEEVRSVEGPGAGTQRADAPYNVKLDGGGNYFTHGYRIQVLRDSPPPAAEEAEGSKVKYFKSGTTYYKDDPDQLPWQVVAIMDKSKMEELWQQYMSHENTQRNAITGGSLPHPAPGSPDAGPPALPRMYELASGPADAAFGAADFPAAAQLYQAQIDLAQEKPAPNNYDLWHEAVMLRKLATCRRRMNELPEALEALDLSLKLFPRYTQALFERAVALLDGGRAVAAVRALELLYRVDRAFPHLLEWLLRAHVRDRRHGSKRVADNFHLGDKVVTTYAVPEYWAAGEEATVTGMGLFDAPISIMLHRSGRPYYARPDQLKPAGREGLPGGGEGMHKPSLAGAGGGGGGAGALARGGAEGERIAALQDHYAALGVSAEASQAEIKAAYRAASRRLHPDKPGGHQAAFARVALAMEVLDDAKRRAEYDFGDDLERPEIAHPFLGYDPVSMRQEVERLYFPDLRGFWLFGDPLTKRREMEAREEAKEEEMMRQSKQIKEEQEARQREAEDARAAREALSSAGHDATEL